jgi:hypothetical protein
MQINADKPFLRDGIQGWWDETGRGARRFFGFAWQREGRLVKMASQELME